VVLCAVALTVAYPLREYLAQRSEISRLESQQVAQQHRVATLQDQQAQLQDPAYVEAQARQRLHFVRPGETAYIVIAPSVVPTPAAGRDHPASTGSARAGLGPWYGQLWSTVRVAGERAAGSPTPAP
jgi:hypothetical protein